MSQQDVKFGISAIGTQYAIVRTGSHMLRIHRPGQEPVNVRVVTMGTFSTAGADYVPEEPTCGTFSTAGADYVPEEPTCGTFSTAGADYVPEEPTWFTKIITRLSAKFHRSLKQ